MLHSEKTEITMTMKLMPAHILDIDVGKNSEEKENGG